MPEPTRSESNDGSPAGPVNEMRVELYERLMEDQERIAQALYTRGVAHNDVLAAFDTADERLSEDQRSEDPYLAALAIYAESLGGRIEVRAVFVMRRSWF